MISIESYYAIQDRTQNRIEESHGLPVVSINTSVYLPYNRDIWHPGNISLFNNLDRRDNVYTVHAHFRGRGNSTWIYSKPPFNVNFEMPIGLAGFDPNTRFIFLAEKFDPSLMRNFLALHLAGKMSGVYHIPQARHVNMYINDVYYGVYLLTEARGQLADNGVYVLELNHEAPGRFGQMNIEWVRANNRYYVIRESVETMTQERGQELAVFLTQASQAILNHDFSAVQRYFDIDSLVDFYLVRELFASHDTGMFSVFMQIKEDETGNRRIHMGPVWDFDVAAGIVNQVSYIPWQEPNWVSLPQGFAIGELNYWFRNLIQIPEFVQALRPRLSYLRFTALPQTLDEMWFIFQTYRDDFERNFTVHPLNVPQHVHSVEGFNYVDNLHGHMFFLDNFLTSRINWLYNVFQDYLPELYFPRRYDQLDIFLNGRYIDFGHHNERGRFIYGKPYIPARWLFAVLFPDQNFDDMRRTYIPNHLLQYRNWLPFVSIEILDMLGIEYRLDFELEDLKFEDPELEDPEFEDSEYEYSEFQIKTIFIYIEYDRMGNREHNET